MREKTVGSRSAPHEMPKLTMPTCRSSPTMSGPPLSPTHGDVFGRRVALRLRAQSITLRRNGVVRAVGRARTSSRAGSAARRAAASVASGARRRSVRVTPQPMTVASWPPANSGVSPVCASLTGGDVEHAAAASRMIATSLTGPPPSSGR